jgi:RNA polymerase sigma-70 factor (ECF subfamily)
MACVNVDDERLRLLVAAAAEGDNVAVGELVRCTQPMVWRVCSALGTAGEEADLVQETYLRALRSLSSYRGDSPVMSWLLSVARHVCADDVRRRQRRRRLADRLAAHERDACVPGPEVVDDVLVWLDADRRAAFVLTQYLGLSYAEAADVLGCPIGTIRSRVSRAREDLAALVRRIEAR